MCVSFKDKQMEIDRVEGKFRKYCIHFYNVNLGVNTF